MNTQKIICATIISIFLLFSNLLFGQTALPAPTGLRVTATECGKVSLAWDEYPVGVLDAQLKVFRFSQSQSSVTLVTLPITNTQYDDLGSTKFLEDEEYTYWIEIFTNSYSSSRSNSVKTTLTSCTKVNDLKVESAECGSIMISWSPVLNGIGYSIYRSETGENGYFTYYQSTTQNSYIDIGESQINGVSSGKTYFYKVKTNFSNLISNYSNIVSASFLCPEPTGLRFLDSKCGDIQLTWDDYPPEILEDGFIIERATSSNGEFNPVGSVNKNFTTFSDRSSILNEGQTYFYKLSGVFKKTWVQSTTIATGNFTCEIPTGLKVTNTECGRINLAWNDYPAGVNETGYDIVRYETNGSTYVLASVGANILNYTITNNNYYSFSPNTTYYYKIAGKFNNKTTQYTAPVSASFTCPTPANLRVVSSDCFTVNLAWDDIPAPYSEAGYIIYRTNNGYFSQIAEVGSNVLSFIDNTYKYSGQTYEYKIVAKINGALTSASNIVNAKIECLAPSDLEVTSATCGEISLKWKNNYTGPVLVFIYRSDTGENGTYNQIHFYQQNLNTYTDKGIEEEGKTYFYKVTVVKNNTTSQFSNVASASFNCVAPINLAISGSSCGEFTLTWPDYPAGFNETGYQILRSTSQTDNSFTYLTEVPANTLTFTDNTVYNYFNNNKFYYKIAGKFNRTITQLSNTVTSDYTCPIVQNLKVVGTGCGQIKIAWDALTSNYNVRNYIIYKSETSNSGYYLIGNVVSSTTNFIDNSSLILGTTYYYKVKALINNIETELGNEVSASFTCNAPTNLQVVSSSCGLINLSWSDYPTGINENGYRIFRYIPNSYSGYVEIANLPANTTTYTDFGNMEADKPQYYKIQGKFSDTFTDFSNVASGSFRCDVPGTLTATSNNCGEIVLNWNDFPSTFPENRYFIYRSDDGVNGNYYQRGLVDANVLTFLDNYNLSPGKSYFYQIKGQYLNSLTVASNNAEAQTNCLSPQNFKVSSTNCGNITLTWDDYPSGVNETGYVIYRSTNGENGNYNLYTTLNANTTSFSDIGANSNELYVNKTYHYKIYGKFGNTTSSASNIVNGSFNCEIPSNLIVRSSNCGAISLKWDDLPSTVSESGFIIYRTTTANGNYSQVGNVNANILQFNDYINLSPGTTYYYKIAAKFGNVVSSLSNGVNASFTCPTPTGLSVTESKCGEISLAWDQTVIASGGYEIYRSDDSNINNKVLVGTVPFNVYSFVDKGINKSLTSGLKYYYSVRAKILATLSNFSNTASTSFNCENPLNLTKVNQACGAITLAWDDFPTLQETGYEVFRSDFGLNGNYVSIGTVNANVLNFVDRGNNQNFYAGREYYYKIKGKLNNNYTEYSNAISAKFDCTLPQNLIVKTSTCGAINLQWDSYLGSTGVQIFRSETGPNGNFNLLHDASYSSANTYTDEGGQGRIIVDKIYHYKIRLKLNYTITDFSSTTSGSFSCAIPQNIIVTNASCGEITLKWDDYPSNISENGYYIYRSNYLNGDYSLIGSTNSNIVTFTDRGQSGGAIFADQTYYYKINGRFINSETLLSDAISSSFQCDVPQNLTASANSCGKIDLSWDLIPNASGYAIYRSEYEFGNYSNVWNLQSNINSYQDIIYNNLSKKYYYKISAKYLTNGFSEQSNIAAAQTTCPIPQNLKIDEVKCGSVKISWDDIPVQFQETGYVIFRIEKNGSNSQYYNVGSVGPNILTFTDTGNINRSFPKNNTSFGYVIAASFGNYGSNTTDYSNEVTTSFDCETIITGIVSATSCGKINLSWTTLTNQSVGTYIITKSNTLLQADFQPIAYIYDQANSFEDRSINMKAGQTYYYKIYGVVGGVSIEPTNIVSASFSCGASPVLSLVSSDCDKVSLSWNDYPTPLVENYYNISRSDGDNNFYFVGRVNANTTTFDDTGATIPLQSGINYKYKVVGYNNTVYFDPSNEVTTILNCHQPPTLSLDKTSCGKIELSWTYSNQNPSADSYVLYRSIGSSQNFYPISPITNTSFIDFGVTQSGQKYFYKVAAKFGNSLSPFSNTISTDFSCANNIIANATTTSCNTIQLYWPADPNQGKNYFYYRIYRSENGLNGDYKEFTNGQISNSLIDDYRIVAGKTYYYKIKTEYNSLLSDFSAPATVTVTCAGFSKSPPANFKTTAQNCSQIDLSWDDFGAANIEESYEIHRSTDGSNYALIASLPANTTSFADKNLLQNTSYFYLIRGKFGAGFSDYSSALSVKTSCASVANFATSGQTCTSISLSWSDLGVLNTEESYEIYRSTDGINFTYLTPIDANITSFTDKNLALNTSYYYQIRGRFGNGFTPFTNTISGKTACQGPSNFVATPQNCTQILLTWSDLGPTNTEESYELYRSTTGLENSYEFIAKIDANATQYLDQSLPTNQQFWYVLRGRFGTGFSPYSATATAKTVPITLLLKSKNAGSVTLNWNICSSDRENWAIFQSTDGKNVTEIKREDALVDFSKIDFLTPGQTYFFWVSPILNTGYGNLSNMITVKIPEFPGPSLLDTTAVTDSTISLKWQDNSNGPDHEESWSLMEQKNDSTWVEINQIDANKIAFTVDSLQADTTYCLAIRARYGMGYSALSNIICIDTKKDTLQNLQSEKNTRKGVSENIEEANPLPKLYPNPAQNYLFINVKNEKLPLTISISDIYGKMIQHDIKIPLDADSELKVNIEKFTHGIYFLYLKGPLKTTVLKFLKY